MRGTKLLIACLAVLVAMAGQSGFCEAGLITNGSFETGKFAVAGDSNFNVFAPGYTGTLLLPGSTGLDGWDISLSPFDPDGVLTFDGFGLEWTNAELPDGTGVGHRWIDLKRGGDLWTVSQSLATIPGREYRLTYLGLAGFTEGGSSSSFRV